MTQEDYCSFETSKLLKEKGFDWMCKGYYKKDDEDSEPYFGDGEGAENWNEQAPSVRDFWFSAPTHQMAMKWLREEKGIYVYVEPYLVGGTNIDELEVHYCGRILDTNRRRLHSIENRTSYTEAIEERIKYALKSLI